MALCSVETKPRQRWVVSWKACDLLILIPIETKPGDESFEAQIEVAKRSFQLFFENKFDAASDRAELKENYLYHEFGTIVISCMKSIFTMEKVAEK